MSEIESRPLPPFLEYLKFQKRYSPHTIVAYETDLIDFFDYLHAQYNLIALSDISSVFIRSWLASLKEKNIASRSINRKVSALRSFFRYQLRCGSIVSSPVTSIVSLKVSKRLPSYIEEKDIETLFRHVEFPDNWEGKTSRLLLMILYQTGIRVNELVNLRAYNIDKANGSIKVFGKGNKERIIPANNELLNQCFLYISNKLSIGNADDEFLLINIKGKKLSARYVYDIVKKYLSVVTTNERKSPHILRHSFATHLTNNGADINAVKELLGHSSLASTQWYTHNSIQKLKDIHKKAHPKS